MYRNIEISYEQIEISPEELDRKIYRALSFLVSPEDLYQNLKINKQNYEQD
jgi:hypothetical protein